MSHTLGGNIRSRWHSCRFLQSHPVITGIWDKVEHYKINTSWPNILLQSSLIYQSINTFPFLESRRFTYSVATRLSKVWPGYKAEFLRIFVRLHYYSVLSIMQVFLIKSLMTSLAQGKENLDSFFFLPFLCLHLLKKKSSGCAYFPKSNSKLL